MSRRIVGVVLTGLVTATLSAVPAIGETRATSTVSEVFAAPIDSDEDGVLDALSTAEALAGAAKKDRPVEDLSQRTETFSAVANPDGTFTSTDHAAAVRVRHGDEWANVDLILEKQPDGTFEPTATSSDVTVGGGGTKEAARVTFDDGKSLALTWPTVLPAPSVKGSVATYSVSDATDLIVTVTGAGVAAHLRLNSRPADDDPIFTFGLRAVNLDVSEARGGGLNMTDQANKKIGSTANLVAWDARTDAAGDPAEIVPLKADLTEPRKGRNADTQTLHLTAPDEYLSDPKRVYPVTIDPDINAVNLIRDTYTRAGDTVPAGTQSKLIVGRLGDSSNTSPARTLIQWENTFLEGKTITAASMNFYQYFGGSCSAKDVNIHPLVGEFYESTAVDTNRPAVDTGTGTSSVFTANKGPSCSGGSGFVSGSVLNMAKAWSKGAASGGFANWGVQLNVPSASGSDTTFERRFCAEELSTTAGDPCATSGRAPYMQFTYSDPAPAAPSTPTVSLDSADATVSTVVTGATSTNLRAKFLVMKGTTTVYDGYSASAPGGSMASVVLPQLAVGTYTVKAWSNNGGQSSAAASSTKTFQVENAHVTLDAPSVVYDSTLVGDTRLDPSEHRTIRINGLGGVPETGTRTVDLKLVTWSGSSSGSVETRPSSTGPLVSTVAINANGSSVSGSTVATATVDGTIDVYNSGSAPVHVKITGSGYNTNGEGLQAAYYELRTEFPDGTTVEENLSTGVQVLRDPSGAVISGDTNEAFDPTLRGESEVDTPVVEDPDVAPDEPEGTTTPEDLVDGPSLLGLDGAVANATDSPVSVFSSTPGGYKVRGGKRRTPYLYTSDEYKHRLRRVKQGTDTVLGTVGSKLEQKLNGGNSVRWNVTAKTIYRGGKGYSAQFEYFCGIDVNNGDDYTCDEVDDVATRQDGPKTFASKTAYDASITKSYRFSSARNKKPFPMVKIAVYWPGYGVTSEGKYRGWDVAYSDTTSNLWKLTNKAKN